MNNSKVKQINLQQFSIKETQNEIILIKFNKTSGTSRKIVEIHALVFCFFIFLPLRDCEKFIYSVDIM